MWPEHTDKAQLAEEVVDYFQQKVQKIRDLLMDKPMYNPSPSDVPRFTKFCTLTETQVLGIINSLKTKSCELDKIQMLVLKKLLPVVLPIITRIVNLSLSEGAFCRTWKAFIKEA